MRTPCVVILGLGNSAAIACAEKYVVEDWSVVIVDRDKHRLEQIDEPLAAQCQLMHEDPTTVLGLKNALSGTLEHYEQVDSVVVSASRPLHETLLTATSSQLQELYQRSAIAAILAVKTFSNEMQLELAEVEENLPPPEKSIQFLLDRSALQAEIGNAATSISHGAILSAIQTLATELAPSSIRLNAIISNEYRVSSVKNISNRIIKPQDVAELCYFLSTPSARLMTGQMIEVDGGQKLFVASSDAEVKGG